MTLEALALERMNDRHIDNNCGCVIDFMQVWMAKPCRHILTKVNCKLSERGV